jgi:hypothetical protein
VPSSAETLVPSNEKIYNGSCICLRDAEPLRRSGQAASRSIAEGAQRREEGGEEDMHPLMRLALPDLHDVAPKGLTYVICCVQQWNLRFSLTPPVSLVMMPPIDVTYHLQRGAQADDPYPG